MLRRAERALVGERSIEIRLNSKGARTLLLERFMTLVVPDKLVGWKKALGVFRRIAGEPSGRTIELVSQKDGPKGRKPR